MSRLRDACLAAAAVLAVSGCSSESDHGNMPDAAIDASATTPPEVLATSPTDLQEQVSVIQPITVFFDRKLDPASVNDATVRLRSSSGYGWTSRYGAVSYDERGYKVTFLPLPAMSTATGYEVTIDGVKDLAGNALTSYRFRFATFINASIRSVNYDSQGAITSPTHTELDERGRQIRAFVHGQPGADGVWFTADDTYSCCPTVNVWSPDGRQTESRGYNDAGPDGKPGTADDVQSSWTTMTYDPGHGQLFDSTSLEPGPDLAFGTADDVPRYYYRYVYDQAGYRTQYVAYQGPGTDGVWKTEDDTCSDWHELILDARGNNTRMIRRQCGADGLPRTADDKIAGVYDAEYDEHGLLTGASTRSAGADGVWLTSDDGTTYGGKYHYDAAGLQTGYTTYYSPGADMVWWTADDEVDYRAATTYTPARQPRENLAFNSPGADMMWGTADDVISSLSSLSYDELGRVIDASTFDAGPDGMFETADDRLESVIQYDLSH